MDQGSNANGLSIPSYLEPDAKCTVQHAAPGRSYASGPAELMYCGFLIQGSRQYHCAITPGSSAFLIDASYPGTLFHLENYS